MASKRKIDEDVEQENTIPVTKNKGKKKKKKAIKEEEISFNSEELLLENQEEEDKSKVDDDQSLNVKQMNGGQKKAKAKKHKIIKEEDIEEEDAPKLPKSKKKNKKRIAYSFEEEEIPEVVDEVVKQEELMIENQEEEDDAKVEEGEEEEDDDDESIMVERTNGRQKPESNVTGKHPHLWPHEDLLVLFDRIERLIPKHDKLRFKSRLDRIQWEHVTFADYTPEDCRQMWDYVQKHIRCFRELREIVQDAKDWANHPWTSYRCVKNKRHPDMPRRPLTSYMMFYMRHKNKFLNERPSIDMPSLSKLIAEKYKTLPATKKDKYMKLAAKGREEYLKKMKIFYQQHPELTPTSRKSIDAPKKPFRLYYESLLEGYDVGDKLAMLEKAKRKWKKMKDNNKIGWINKALAQTGDEINAVEFKKKIQNLLTKEERFLKEKMAGKPEKPPASAYRLFAKQYAAEHADTIIHLDTKDRITFIGQKWKECSADDKKKYKAELQTLIEKYNETYNQYFSSLTEEEQAEEVKKNKKTEPKPSTSNDKPKKVAKKEIPIAVDEKEEQPTTSAIRDPELVEDDDDFLKPEPRIFEGEPEPPPLHPLILFAREKAKEMNDKLTRDQAHQLWSQLTSKEKSKWDSKLKSLKTCYITLYEKFLKSLSRDDLSTYAQLKDAANAAAAKKYPKKEMSSCESASDSESGSGKTCSSSYSGSGSGSSSSSESESDKED